MTNDKQNIAIIGASGGIGGALVSLFLNRPDTACVYGFSRSVDPNRLGKNEKLVGCQLDITDESSFKSAIETLPDGFVFDYVIVASGLLHSMTVQPEKSIQSVSKLSFIDVLTVNTVGPALVMKYFLPLLRPNTRSVIAILSARVGSISDNRLGGWYAYRASKSAVNMVIKTAAIEQARRQKQHIIIGIHPGSVDTALSKPFQSRSQYHFQRVESAAEHIEAVLRQCDVASSGKVFDWKGDEVLP